MSKTRRFFLYWLPVIVWMIVIFGASSDTGSFQRSSRIIAPLLHFLFPNLSEDTVSNVVTFARKGAHLTEYAILGFLVWRARRKSPPPAGIPWRWSEAAAALWVAALYAATDEYHQTYVASREGCLRDVLIDSSGAAMGLVALWLFIRWRYNRSSGDHSDTSGTPALAGK